MSFRKNNAGFSAVELVIILVVVSVFAFVGYRVYSQQEANNAADEGTSQSAVANDVPAAPEIESVDDLDKASATLDDINLDDNGDQSQLDSELATF